MKCRHETKFSQKQETNELPEWSAGGVAVLTWMRNQLNWDAFVDGVRIQREGGYAGIDGFLYLLYYFCAELSIGLTEFNERKRKYNVQLAAIGNRATLPSRTALSGILGAVKSDWVREFGDELLLKVAGVKPVLNHPTVLNRDALGQGWHVFDWDPTVTTLRQRALPALDGTPEPVRRSEELAKPGFPGRKRGNVQFSQGTLQHAGSGLWLGLDIAPGNGSGRLAFERAVAQVTATCEFAEISRSDAIVRADGAAGNVPFITACREAGLHYITRLSHYKLLKDILVQKSLDEIDWFSVPSSGSGPSREAAELGTVRLYSERMERTDGRRYEAVQVRVVVSRFKCDKKGKKTSKCGAGVEIDGWQYELYATSLSASAWPDAEIVAGYYGRVGQENRFSQKNKVIWDESNLQLPPPWPTLCDSDCSFHLEFSNLSRHGNGRPSTGPRAPETNHGDTGGHVGPTPST